MAEQVAAERAWEKWVTEHRCDDRPDIRAAFLVGWYACAEFMAAAMRPQS